MSVSRQLLLFVLIILCCAPVQAGQTWMTWNEASGLPGSNLVSLAVTDGLMAVASTKGIGLFCQDYLRWFDLGEFDERLTGLAARSLDFDDYKTLWAATPRGLFAINLEEFPLKQPRVTHYDKRQGLSTIDVEIVQVHQGKLYVGCFGGWLFSGEIQLGGDISSFRPANAGQLGREDQHRIMSVGITAIAMDYPGGGLYSTKGAGLLNLATGRELVAGGLSSDWVNDFWAFQQEKYNRVIAVTQDKMTLINNNQIVAQIGLPVESWVSCLTTAPLEESETYKRPKAPGYEALEAFVGDRILYAGTRGQGLWIFKDGRWSNYTTKDSPLPSDNINKIYYLHGARKLAVLSEAGLTMIGIDHYSQFDLFEHAGAAPYWAKTMWPFMSLWGPYVFGYPSQYYYPIEPSISYGKMIRGKDLWLVHDKGLSQYVFPSAPFIGAMQYRYRLAGRYDNPENDPSFNKDIEDNSTSGDIPPFLPGENVWHHYCKEQPADISLAPLEAIFVTLDLKTMIGPCDSVDVASIPAEVGENQMLVPGGADQPPVIVEIPQMTPESATDMLAAHPDVTHQGDSFVDSRGHQLFSVASLMQECPLHPIPHLNITDIALDFGERLWVVFDESLLYCLRYKKAGEYIAPDQVEFIDFGRTHLPWHSTQKILCLKALGSTMYVSLERSGVYYLPSAHSYEVDQITPSRWQRIDLPEDGNDPGLMKNVIAIENWSTSSGDLVALLHEEALSLFDGASATPFAVPKATYTSMVVDRFNNLWLGSKQGLIYITPDFKMEKIHGAANDFNSDNIVTMAAAPDDAKYPYVIAVATADRISDDPAPALVRGSDSAHRLRVINTEIIGGPQIMLYDGEKWEPMARPGVRHMMFDQSFLWISTTNRVIRLYMPTVVQNF